MAEPKEIPTKRKVCVIGAGAAGLIAARTLLRYGIDVVVFERESFVGGIWHYHDELLTPGGANSPIYTDLTTNLPPAIMAVSDFPFRFDLPQFPHRKEVEKYLKTFASKFGIKKVIKLNTTVAQVDWSDENAQWSVQTASQGEVQTELYDGVVVANGHYEKLVIPTFNGQEKFSGKIQHSATFRKASDFEDKTVLIIGGNISGFDLASITLQAQQKYITENNIPTDKQPKVILSVRRKVSFITPKYIAKFKKRDRCHVVGAISEFTGPNSVAFTDGMSIDNIDRVILATGYDYDFPFLKDNGKFLLSSNGRQVLSTYEHIFYTEHPSLTFVGLPYSLISPFTVFEFQSNFIAAVYSGGYTLPDKQIMEKEVSDRRSKLSELDHDSLALKSFTYTWRISKRIGDSPAMSGFWLQLFTRILWYTVGCMQGSKGDSSYKQRCALLWVMIFLVLLLPIVFVFVAKFVAGWLVYMLGEEMGRQVASLLFVPLAMLGPWRLGRKLAMW